MKQCFLCQQGSPFEALFCINCGCQFTACTGDTEKLNREEIVEDIQKVSGMIRVGNWLITDYIPYYGYVEVGSYINPKKSVFIKK